MSLHLKLRPTTLPGLAAFAHPGTGFGAGAQLVEWLAARGSATSFGEQAEELYRMNVSAFVAGAYSTRDCPTGVIL